MTFEEFQSSVKEPVSLPVPLRALWQEARGNWENAHILLQKDSGVDAAWVHAYLHRREGSLSNAQHWYAQAGKPESIESLEKEWEHIARDLLKNTE